MVFLVQFFIITVKKNRNYLILRPFFTFISINLCILIKENIKMKADLRENSVFSIPKDFIS